MTRFEQIKQILDVPQLIAYLEKYSAPCTTKASGENWQKWCKSYGIDRDSCYRCKVDFWNEEVE